ncbi:hypothetical protein KKC59_02435, partial [bacterium]|nr:hypothetical protein [bacterium]
IRPMMYIEESEIIEYAKKKKFLSVTCNCPENVNKNRKDMKKLIQKLKKENPKIVNNILIAGLMYYKYNPPNYCRDALHASPNQHLS